MSAQPGADITALLADWSGGNQQALDHLMPLVYDELRRLAAIYLRRERSGHTLQSTALANEAFLRLIGQNHTNWKDRAHFFAIASQMIRRILVDHARARIASKRGAGAIQLSLDDALGVPDQPGGLDVLRLDDALNALAALDERQSRVVELRFFGGLSIEETAAVMELSTATVKREWTSARAWLFREMSRRSA